MARYDIVIFDLDGTLIDSDDALLQPFLDMGFRSEDIAHGYPVEEFCASIGVDVLEYVNRYDTDIVQPFDGAAELVTALDRWAVCSNKYSDAGQAELARLGWKPEVALFSRDFGGRAKELGPVLAAVDVTADRALFVGDTTHDATTAAAVGCDFVWAAWNPRTAAMEPTGTVLTHPSQVLDLLV